MNKDDTQAARGFRQRAEAIRACFELLRQGLLGADGYRGFGDTFEQCVGGMVSERCGGSPSATNLEDGVRRKTGGTIGADVSLKVAAPHSISLPR